MGAIGTTLKFAFNMVADRSRFAKQLELAGQDIGRLRKQASTGSQALGAVQVGAAAGFTALTGAVAGSIKTFQQYGQGIKLVSRMTGASAEEASKLTAQWARFDVTGKHASMGLRTFSRQYYQATMGTDAQQKASLKKFSDAGVDAASVKTLGFYDLVMKVRDGMSQMSNATDRTALSVYMFGRAGTSLIPWLTTGKEEFAQLKQMIQDSGLVWDNKKLQSWYTMMKNWRETQLMFKGIQMTIASAVLPYLDKGAAALQKFMGLFNGVAAHLVIPALLATGTVAGFGLFLKIVSSGFISVGRLAGGIVHLTKVVVGLDAASAEGGFSKFLGGLGYVWSSVKNMGAAVVSMLGKVRNAYLASAGAESLFSGGGGAGFIGSAAKREKNAAAIAGAAAAEKAAAREAEKKAARVAEASAMNTGETVLAYSAGGNIVEEIKRISPVIKDTLFKALASASKGFSIAKNFLVGGVQGVAIKFVTWFGGIFSAAIALAFEIGGALRAALEKLFAWIAAQMAISTAEGVGEGSLLSSAGGIAAKLGKVVIGLVASVGAGLGGTELYEGIFGGGTAAAAGVAKSSGGIIASLKGVKDSAKNTALSVKQSLSDIGSSQRQSQTVALAREGSNAYLDAANTSAAASENGANRIAEAYSGAAASVDKSAVSMRSSLGKVFKSFMAGRRGSTGAIWLGEDRVPNIKKDVDAGKLLAKRVAIFRSNDNYQNTLTTALAKDVDEVLRLSAQRQAATERALLAFDPAGERRAAAEFLSLSKKFLKMSPANQELQITRSVQNLFLRVAGTNKDASNALGNIYHLTRDIATEAHRTGSTYDDILAGSEELLTRAQDTAKGIDLTRRVLKTAPVYRKLDVSDMEKIDSLFQSIGDREGTYSLMLQNLEESIKSASKIEGWVAARDLAQKRLNTAMAETERINARLKQIGEPSLVSAKESLTEYGSLLVDRDIAANRILTAANKLKDSEASIKEAVSNLSESIRGYRLGDVISADQLAVLDSRMVRTRTLVEYLGKSFKEARIAARDYDLETIKAIAADVGAGSGNARGRLFSRLSSSIEQEKELRATSRLLDSTGRATVITQEEVSSVLTDVAMAAKKEADALSAGASAAEEAAAKVKALLGGLSVKLDAIEKTRKALTGGLRYGDTSFIDVGGAIDEVTVLNQNIESAKSSIIALQEAVDRIKPHLPNLDVNSDVYKEAIQAQTSLNQKIESRIALEKRLAAITKPSRGAGASAKVAAETASNIGDASTSSAALSDNLSEADRLFIEMNKSAKSFAEAFKNGVIKSSGDPVVTRSLFYLKKNMVKVYTDLGEATKAFFEAKHEWLGLNYSIDTLDKFEAAVFYHIKNIREGYTASLVDLQGVLQEFRDKLDAAAKLNEKATAVNLIKPLPRTEDKVVARGKGELNQWDASAVEDYYVKLLDVNKATDRATLSSIKFTDARDMMFAKGNSFADAGKSLEDLTGSWNNLIDTMLPSKDVLTNISGSMGESANTIHELLLTMSEDDVAFIGKNIAAQMRWVSASKAAGEKVVFDTAKASREIESAIGRTFSTEELTGFMDVVKQASIQLFGMARQQKGWAAVRSLIRDVTEELAAGTYKADSLFTRAEAIAREYGSVMKLGEGSAAFRGLRIESSVLENIKGAGLAIDADRAEAILFEHALNLAGKAVGHIGENKNLEALLGSGIKLFNEMGISAEGAANGVGKASLEARQAALEALGKTPLEASKLVTEALGQEASALDVLNLQLTMSTQAAADNLGITRTLARVFSDLGGNSVTAAAGINTAADAATGAAEALTGAAEAARSIPTVTLTADVSGFEASSTVVRSSLKTLAVEEARAFRRISNTREATLSAVYTRWAEGDRAVATATGRAIELHAEHVSAVNRVVEKALRDADRANKAIPEIRMPAKVMVPETPTLPETNFDFLKASGRFDLGARQTTKVLETFSYSAEMYGTRAEESLTKHAFRMGKALAVLDKSVVETSGSFKFVSSTIAATDVVGEMAKVFGPTVFEEGSAAALVYRNNLTAVEDVYERLARFGVTSIAADNKLLTSAVAADIYAKHLSAAEPALARLTLAQENYDKYVLGAERAWTSWIPSWASLSADPLKPEVSELSQLNAELVAARENYTKLSNPLRLFTEFSKKSNYMVEQGVRSFFSSAKAAEDAAARDAEWAKRAYEASNEARLLGIRAQLVEGHITALADATEKLATATWNLRNMRGSTDVMVKLAVAVEVARDNLVKAAVAAAKFGENVSGAVSDAATAANIAAAMKNIPVGASLRFFVEPGGTKPFNEVITEAMREMVNDVTNRPPVKVPVTVEPSWKLASAELDTVSIRIDTLREELQALTENLTKMEAYTAHVVANSSKYVSSFVDRAVANLETARSRAAEVQTALNAANKEAEGLNTIIEAGRTIRVPASTIADLADKGSVKSLQTVAEVYKESAAAAEELAIQEKFVNEAILETTKRADEAAAKVAKLDINMNAGNTGYAEELRVAREELVGLGTELKNLREYAAANNIVITVDVEATNAGKGFFRSVFSKTDAVTAGTDAANSAVDAVSSTIKASTSAAEPLISATELISTPAVVAESTKAGAAAQKGFSSAIAGIKVERTAGEVTALGEAGKGLMQVAEEASLFSKAMGPVGTAINVAFAAYTAYSSNTALIAAAKNSTDVWAKSATSSGFMQATVVGRKVADSFAFGIADQITKSNKEHMIWAALEKHPDLVRYFYTWETVATHSRTKQEKEQGRWVLSDENFYKLWSAVEHEGTMSYIKRYNDDQKILAYARTHAANNKPGKDTEKIQFALTDLRQLASIMNLGGIKGLNVFMENILPAQILKVAEALKKGADAYDKYWQAKYRVRTVRTENLSGGFTDTGLARMPIANEKDFSKAQEAAAAAQNAAWQLAADMKALDAYNRQRARIPQRGIPVKFKDRASIPLPATSEVTQAKALEAVVLATGDAFNVEKQQAAAAAYAILENFSHVKDIPTGLVDGIKTVLAETRKLYAPDVSQLIGADKLKDVKKSATTLFTNLATAGKPLTTHGSLAVAVALQTKIDTAKAIDAPALLNDLQQQADDFSDKTHSLRIQLFPSINLPSSQSMQSVSDIVGQMTTNYGELIKSKGKDKQAGAYAQEERAQLIELLKVEKDPAAVKLIDDTLARFPDLIYGWKNAKDAAIAYTEAQKFSAAQLKDSIAAGKAWLTQQHTFEITTYGKTKNTIKTVTETGEQLRKQGKALFDTKTGTVTLLNSVQQIADAMSGAQLVTANKSILDALGSIPDSIIKTLEGRNWKAVGKAILKAGKEFGSALSSLTADQQKAVVDNAANINSIAGALGSALTTLSTMPTKFITPVRQNYKALGAYINQSLTELASSFKDGWLQINSQRATYIADIATGLGNFLAALTGMPTNTVNMFKQNWTLLGNALRVAMNQILAVFASMGDLQTQATKMGNIGSIASDVASLITSFVTITGDSVNKALAGLTAISNNAKALASEIALILNTVLDVFKAKGLAISATQATDNSNIFGMITSVGDIITTFSAITKAMISGALANLKSLEGSTAPLGEAMVGVITSIQSQFSSKSLSGVADLATTTTDVVGIITGIGSVITTFSAITKAMVNDAITGLVAAAVAVGTDTGNANHTTLGGAMLLLVTRLQAVFSSKNLPKTTALAATVTDVVSVVNGIGSVVTTFATITKTMVQSAITGLNAAATYVGVDGLNIGGAMIKVVNAISKSISDSKNGFSSSATLSSQVTDLTTIAGNVGTILTQFAALTEEGIATAVQNMNTVANNDAPQISVALMNMATSLQHVFSANGINAKFADSMTAIGTVMTTVEQVFTFATSMTDSNIQLLTAFAQGTGVVEGLWHGVGVALTNVIEDLISSVGKIPDSSQLSAAEAAISSLSNIFSSLTTLMGSVTAAESWVSSAPTVTTPAGGSNTGVSYVPPTTPVVSGVDATAAAPGNSYSHTDVNISWQTLTGEPSVRETRQLVAVLKPEFDRLSSNKLRTSF